MVRQVNPNLPAVIHKRLDATFMGDRDNEGNEQFADLRIAYQKLHGISEGEYSALNIEQDLCWYDGDQFLEKIRCVEETVAYIKAYSVQQTWGIAVGDSIQRVLKAQYDNNPTDSMKGRPIIPYPSVTKFIKTTRDNGSAKMVSRVEIGRGALLNHPAQLPGKIRELVADFKKEQYARIPDDTVTVHVSPDKYPRLLRIRCTENGIALYACGRLLPCKE